MRYYFPEPEHIKLHFEFMSSSIISLHEDIAGRERSSEQKQTLCDESLIHRQIEENAAAAKTPIAELKIKEILFPESRLR